MSELGYNIYGAIVGTVGVFALVPALALAILGLPPTSKLKISEGILQETERMFRDAVEEGLIYRDDDLHIFHTSFWSIKLLLDDARVDVYCIRSWTDELVSWWQGLSGKIHIAYKETCKLRKRLAKTSSRERRALAAAGYTTKLASMSGIRSRASRITSGLPSSYYPESSTPSPEPEYECIATDIACPHPNTRGCREHHHYHQSPVPASPSSRPIAAASHLCECPQDGCATHHVVADADLKELLLIALSQPVTQAEDGGGASDKRRRRAARQEVLLRFGRQLYGPEFTPPPGHGRTPPPEPLGTHGRFKAFSRLLWCTYSSRLHEVGEYAEGYGRGESPTSQDAGTGGCNACDVD